jgi:DNA-binding transcriptional LysR family regulator
MDRRYVIIASLRELAVELEQLRTFAAVARLGSLSAASEAVHLSQPAVSRQVQALERRLGARLLERSGRGVRLTEAGGAVARAAGEVLSRLEELDAELELLRGGEGGTLRLGATVTVCLYLLPPLLRRYRHLYPRQEIVLVNERSRQIPELVRERRIDIGIASSAPAPPGVRRVAWRELALVLLDSAANGPLDDASSRLLERHAARLGSRAERSEASRLTDLRPPFVLASTGSLRSLMEQVLARAGIEPRVVAEADSVEVVKRLVLDGFGRALVPAANVTDEDRAAGLQTYPLPEHTPRLPVVLWLRDTPYSPPPVRNFLALAALMEPVTQLTGGE